MIKSPHVQKLPNRFQLETENFKKLHWLERIKLLLGWNLIVTTVTRVDKRDGRCWQAVTLKTTRALDKEGQVRENITSVEGSEEEAPEE